MNTSADDGNKTSRRSFAKYVAAVLAGIPFASALGLAQGKRKPQTRRSWVTDDDLRKRQTSPITIGGGGSVGIGFDDTHYERINPGEFSHLTDELITTFVTHQSGATLRNFVREIKGKTCKVRLTCLDSRGGDSPIVIESRRRGPLLLRFSEYDYPYDAAKEVHYNRVERKVTKVVVTSGGNTYPFDVPADWKGVILADDL